jgi:hypothetical protein
MKQELIEVLNPNIPLENNGRLICKQRVFIVKIQNTMRQPCASKWNNCPQINYGLVYQWLSWESYSCAIISRFYELYQVFVDWFETIRCNEKRLDFIQCSNNQPPIVTSASHVSFTASLVGNTISSTILRPPGGPDENNTFSQEEVTMYCGKNDCPWNNITNPGQAQPDDKTVRVRNKFLHFMQ